MMKQSMNSSSLSLGSLAFVSGRPAQDNSERRRKKDPASTTIQRLSVIVRGLEKDFEHARLLPPIAVGADDCRRQNNRDRHRSE